MKTRSRRLRKRTTLGSPEIVVASTCSMRPAASMENGDPQHADSYQKQSLSPRVVLSVRI